MDIINSKVTIEIEYADESSYMFELTPLTESSNEYQHIVNVVTRGTLMASHRGVKATAYNLEGFPIAQYRQ